RPEADARAEKQELTAAKLALNAAGRAVARAAESLAEAQEAAWTTVPSSEVAFISDLPRRVDAANMVVGQIIGAGSADGGTDAGEASDVIVLSGAQVEITAQVPGSQALLVPEGSHATITVVDGAEIAATVATVCAAPDSQEHCELGIRVADEQDVGSDALSGNVRVSITVGTSAPDALIVPLAAVSSKMSGQAQVQLVTNLVKDAPTSDQETSMVAVDVGLSADGYVEVRPVDGTLRPGDLVVVGVETSGAGVAPEGVAGVVTADMPGKASGAVPEDVAENTPEAVLEDAENVAGTVLEDVTGVATGGMADAVGAVLDTQWKPP
ncbi:MAG: hypothetical protein LBK59_11850, partial [Bifidobacteriaceae bacterium]|nr:hypothetical protein [Bifidobacteriaceae bacterium]